MVDAEADDAMAEALLEEGEDVEERRRVRPSRARADDGVAAAEEVFIEQGALGELEERGRVGASSSDGEVRGARRARPVAHTSSKVLQNVTSERPSRSALRWG